MRSAESALERAQARINGGRERGRRGQPEPGVGAVGKSLGHSSGTRPQIEGRGVCVSAPRGGCWPVAVALGFPIPFVIFSAFLLFVLD